MKLILRFLKPHWKLCLITILLIAIDVAGALIVPTLASRMLNEGIDGSPMDKLAVTAAAMAIAAIISGAGGVLSGYTCAALTSRVRSTRNRRKRNGWIPRLPNMRARP